MASLCSEFSPHQPQLPVDLPPALNAAVIIAQVLSARVLNGLPVRPTQWTTLGIRVTEWRGLLADTQLCHDRPTRSHLNVLTQLMQAILEAHCNGADAGADVWLELQPMVHAANDHLQRFPMPIRKGSSLHRHSAAAAGSTQFVDR